MPRIMIKGGIWKNTEVSGYTRLNQAGHSDDGLYLEYTSTSFA